MEVQIKTQADAFAFISAELQKAKERVAAIDLELQHMRDLNHEKICAETYQLKLNALLPHIAFLGIDATPAQMNKVFNPTPVTPATGIPPWAASAPSFESHYPIPAWANKAVAPQE